MKHPLTLIAAIVELAIASNIFAQNTRIATTITTQKHDPTFSLGRDFWIAPGQDDEDEGGKYYRLYITSPNATTAFVESEGIVRAVPVPSYGVGTFNMPLSWEMKSSGKVESKGVHVYDPTDDIEVYLLSHAPYGSDGMYSIPTIGWGNDYVVASYESIFEGGINYTYDLPSEFTITSDQDNTLVAITPSTALRLASVFPDSETTAAFPKGQKFSVMLNRGQSVQYQAVDATDSTGYDVTGTIIHSSNSVGVVGASMCPNIPVNFAYCNYITDMIPPVRSWGETYYTTNPAQTQTGHDYAMYCIISSVPNQVINRYDATTGDHVEARLGNAYDHYFVEEELANKFYSDAPFLLVEYSNSASYPDNSAGSSDPSEVVIPARENFAKTTLFLAPLSVGAQEPYNNYAYLIVNANDSHVMYDGKSISDYAKQAIDDTFEIVILPHVSPGAHAISSDSGVGAYLFGDGSDETYSWGASSKVATFNSGDNTPPVGIVSSICFAANVHITDSGYLQTSLDEIRLDTDINMAYQPDLYPYWLDGAGIDTTGYSMYVVDLTKPAKLVVDAFDYAGNRTTITSIYSPQIAGIFPALQNFGVGLKTDSRVVMYDTLVNSGQTPFTIQSLRLKYGNKGFRIDSADTKDPLAVGERRLIKISFSSVQTAFAVDSVFFGDECFFETAALIGFSGAPDFYVEDVNWVNVPLNPIFPVPGWTMKEAVIHNLSKIAIHVDTAGWTDHQHFVLVPGQTFPITLAPYPASGDTAGAWFYFEPADLNRDTTQVSWKAPEVLNQDNSISARFDELTGEAITPLIKFRADTVITLDCPDTSVHSIQLAFVLSNSGNEGGVINGVTVTNPANFTGLMGHDQHGKTWDPTKLPQGIPAGAIDTFIVTVPVSATSSSAVASLIIADIVGQAPDTLSATVNVSAFYTDVSAAGIDFGTVPWMGSKVTQSITITDTTPANVIIGSIAFMPNNKYNASYSFTASAPLPDTLTSGQSVTVTVTFDPSISGDPKQNATIYFDWNTCNAPAVDLTATLSGSGVPEEAPQPSLASILQLDDGRSIRVVIPSDWTPPAHLEIYNILGVKVFSSSLVGTATIDLEGMPQGQGVYFYHLRSEEASQAGKIVILE